MEKGADPVAVGVLALQGSFREHISSLNRLTGVTGVEIRTKEQLAAVDGLIIPGGESTTMALVAERWGLIPDLKLFASNGKPIWGTCAGLIFLADRATGQKVGGQSLLGGLDCLVHRNFFGAQINSFETRLPAPSCLPAVGPQSGDFRAIFIRAPAVIQSGPKVQVLAQYRLTPGEAQISIWNPARKHVQGEKEVAVAVRSGTLLATAFHPELTDDVRWHQLFVDMVREKLAIKAAERGGEEQASASLSNGTVKSFTPPDLPIYH